MSQLRGAVLLLLLLLLAAGCSAPTGVSEGVVRFVGGEPVRSGSVEFRSTADGSRYAGRIGLEGQFSLSDGEGNPGIPPGEYEVVVVQMVLTEDLPLGGHTHGKTVPRRYADYRTSGIRVTSTEGGEPLHIVIEAED